MSVLSPLSERAAAPADLPRPDGGLTWRPLTPGDAPALHRLVVTIEEADAEPYRMSLPQVVEQLADASLDLATGTLAGVDADGVLRAYSTVTSPAGDVTIRRAFLQGGVHPQWRGRGIGTDLLAWSTGRARQILATCDEPLPGRIGAFLEDDAPPTSHDLFAAAGFAPIRFYTDLRRDLALPIPEADLGAGLRLEAWTPELDEPARLAHNDAFRDHWGSQPRTPEAWVHERSTFAPEWTLVVVDEDPHVNLDPETAEAVRAGAPLVVGYHWAGRYEEDFLVRGYSFGYTNLLGVRRQWRGRGIAPALLTAGMRAFAASGMQYAVLDVDTKNPSGAGGLYAALGYTKTEGSQLVTLEL